MIKNKICFLFAAFGIFNFGMNGVSNSMRIENNEIANVSEVQFETIHIFVALCDNQYQGIVPVPAKIGRGNDPNNNLYWGCGFGVRTFFKNSKEWKLVKTLKVDTLILERLVFKHTTKNYYLVADAYNGKYIEQCTTDFLNACSGNNKSEIKVDNQNIAVGGNSKLLGYIGHDGLMDFNIEKSFRNSDGEKRDCIILACISKKYFAPHLKTSNVNPLVWTTGLMCPEAYTLHDALSGYVNNETNTQVRDRAAAAYSKYQKCGYGAAKRLLVTGW